VAATQLDSGGINRACSGRCRIKGGGAKEVLDVSEAASPHTRAAFHQAGHAVAAVLLGVACRGASVLEETDSLGRVRLAVPTWLHPEGDNDARTRRWVKAKVQVGWAGMVAEVELCHTPLALARAGSQADLSAMAALATYAVGSQEELEAYLEWLRCRTVNLVRHCLVQQRITKVAEALLDHGQLTRGQIRALALPSRTDDTRHPADRSALDQPPRRSPEPLLR